MIKFKYFMVGALTKAKSSGLNYDMDTVEFKKGITFGGLFITLNEGIAKYRILKKNSEQRGIKLDKVYALRPLTQSEYAVRKHFL